MSSFACQTFPLRAPLYFSRRPELRYGEIVGVPNWPISPTIVPARLVMDTLRYVGRLEFGPNGAPTDQPHPLVFVSRKNYEPITETDFFGAVADALLTPIS